MRPNESISISLVDEARRALPISNVIVEVVLFVNGERRYQFYAGQTDGNGQLLVEFSYLESERVRSAAQNLMDYNTPLESCDKQVRLHVPTMQELNERLIAVEKWYPTSAPALLARIRGCTNANISAKDVTATTELRAASDIAIHFIDVDT